MNIREKLFSASLVASVYVYTALPAFAQDNQPVPPPTDPDRNIVIFNPFTQIANVTPNDVIRWIFNVLIVVAILAALVWLLIGGVKWVISGGDKEKIEGARKQIVAALVGLIIVILTFVVLTFILGLFGVNLGNELLLPTLNDPDVFDPAP